MQNEFEKQVQQKLEELNLVPSEPVWQKVEMQIHRKTDRRKLIFWIPLLLVLLSGGLWIGLNDHSKEVPYGKTASTKKINTLSHPITIAKQKENAENQEKTAGEKPANEMASTKTTETRLKGNLQTVSQKLIAKKKISPSIEEKPNTSAIALNNGESEKQFPDLTDKNTDTILSKKERRDSLAVATPVQQSKNETILKNDSLKKYSSSIVPVLKKKEEKKWNYALVVDAGASGLGRFTVFAGEKSLNAAVPGYNNGSSAGNPVYYGPSNVQKGFSFSAGAAAEKQLGKRTSFSAGLGYHYYSNIIYVGSRVMQNRVIMDFAVSQFYSTSSTLQPYRNQYHFISLPITIHWQLLRKAPLHLSTGLSLQYLVQTNALRFDYATQSYFHNIKAFNRTQVFSELGLTYSVSVKQKALTLGPQLQYGLSRLEKGNSSYHLASYGFMLQWQLSKK